MVKSRLLVAAVASAAFLVLPTSAAVAKSGGGGGGSGGATTAIIQFKQGSYSVADNAGQAVVSVVRSGNTANDVSAYFTTSGGTATAGTDYTTTVGPVEFLPGVTAAQVHIPVMTDGPYDGNQTVNMYLSSPQVLSGGGSAQLGSKNAATLTIMDTSPVPTLSVNSPAAVNEGSPVNFTVSISGTSALPISVNYATANGSASSPGNYAARSGSLSWAPGDTSTRTVVVSTVDNGTVDTPNPLTFTLGLSGAINATITTAQGTGSISEIDPGVAIADSSVWLPTGGTATLYLPVTLTGSPAQDATVNWTTITAGSATYGTGPNNACVPGNDFVTGSGSLVFPAHTLVLTQYIGVTVCGEASALADDTVWVHLTGTSYGSINPGYGIGTLHNSVPASTSVTLETTPSLPLGWTQNARVKVLNTSGLGIPNAPFRGEIWRDRSPQDGFVQLVGAGLGATNGSTDGSSEYLVTFTDAETVGARDWVEACVPGMNSATASTCGQTMTDPDGDHASYENTQISANPAGATFSFATFAWDGPSQTVATFTGASEASNDNATVTFSGPVCRTATFSSADWSASGSTTGANPVVSDTIPLCGSSTVTSATVVLNNFWLSGPETVTLTLNDAVLVNGNGALVVPPQAQPYSEDG